MATTPDLNTINLVGLDFDDIKANLKNYLRTNSAFKDVDFEGSNMAVLIDVLAYNTYQNAYYMNMVAGEMWMDSAQLRDSIVSHAKELNYLPRSFRSAEATVNLTIVPASPVESVFVPKGTTFTARIGSNTHTFSTANNNVLTSANNTYELNSLSLFEGVYVTDTFVYDTTLDDDHSHLHQRFILSNPTIDTDSLTVTVVENGGSTVLTYVYADNIVDVKSSSQVYFLQAAENGQFEVLFGTDVIGRRPKNGAVIICEYRTCSGELPNGASVFTPDGPIDGHSNVTVETIGAAGGGAIAEGVESIRFTAPRYFQTQGRAITVDDYKTILTSQFPEIDAISVYGGEDAVPPQYGKVFISVNQDASDGISAERKRIYRDFINTKVSLTTAVEFIDPDFLYIVPSISVSYDINSTTKNAEDIKALVAGVVSLFNDDNIDDFNVTLRYSKLINAIDNADPSILSNDTDLTLYKIINPTVGEPFTTSFSFDNAIRSDIFPPSEIHAAGRAHAITSSVFVYKGVDAYIEDDAVGNLRAVTYTSTNHNILPGIIGTVDYDTGKITINKLLVDSYAGEGIKIYARPRNKDIDVYQNNILTIRDGDIAVTTVSERM